MTSVPVHCVQAGSSIEDCSHAVLLLLLCMAMNCVLRVSRTQQLHIQLQMHQESTFIVNSLSS